MGVERKDITSLAKPFSAKVVESKQGADYVNHGVVWQRLLGTLDTPPSVRIVDVVRGPFDERQTGSNKSRTWPGRDNAVVGVVVEVTFLIDGRDVVIQEVGTPEGYYMADHDGDRLKKAVSDGLKRAAMRVGVALNLWSKGAYFLPAMLERPVDPETGEGPESSVKVDPDAPDPDAVAAEDDEVQAARPDARPPEHGPGGDAPTTPPSPPGPSTNVWEELLAAAPDSVAEHARSVAADRWNGVPFDGLDAEKQEMYVEWLRQLIREAA